MKNVLIAGGAGFVGRHLVQWLFTNSTAKRIVIFDNLSSGSWRNIPPSGSIELIVCDLKNTERLNRAMKGIDTVFMLAANPDISKAVKEPDIDFREGTVLVQNVLEAMRLNETKRIFYMSGSGVYGDNSAAEFEEEYGPMRPISTYGASKLACEAMICAYCHMFGMTGRAFRCANIVGPNQTHGVGLDFVKQLTKDPTKLTILGDGSQTKSYISVHDVIAAIQLIERLADCSYEVYNVATEDAISVTDIAWLATEGIRKLHSVAFSYTGGNRGWKGDVPIVRMNCSKIRFLGWRPTMNSEQAMRTALASMWKERE